MSVAKPGFGRVPHPKPKRRPNIITTLSPEETKLVLRKMYEFLECGDNLMVLRRMAIRRYGSGEGRGTVVAAPWQHLVPDIVPTHYMLADELKASGLAFPGILYDQKRYKPHAQFHFIYWLQDKPKTLAASQLISFDQPLIKRI